MISLQEIAQNMKEAEVDDDKIIKYKDKEGESQEMTAGAAKKQPDDHPAKQAWNKMAGDGGDGEKDSGGKLGKGDFDRDSNKAGDDDADDMDRDARFDADAEDEPKDEPKGKLSPKKQAAVDELEYLSDPDEIGDWLEDNQFYLRKGRLGRAGQINVNKFIDKYRDLEDSYGDDDEYDEKLQNLKDMINKTMDRYRKKSESIKVINGKKYKAIKESKKHPLKEIYDRTFRSLK